MVWVMEHSEEKLGRRLVLLALAEFAHDDGTKAFPAVATIAKRTRLSERQVQRALGDLATSGSIEQTGTTSRGVRVWKITMGRQNVTPGGDNMSGGEDKMSPDPLVKEPVLSPNGSSTSRQRDELWDVISEILGEPSNEGERGRRNKALKWLRESGATPDLIRRAIREYRKRWPEIDLTATALATNWTALTAKKSARPKGERAEEWVRAVGWQYPDEDLAEELTHRGVTTAEEKRRLMLLAKKLQSQQEVST